MFSSYIQNNHVYGPDGAVLNTARIGHRFVPELLQPWLDNRGRSCVTIPTGQQAKDKEGKLVFNSAGQPVQEKRDYLCSDLEKMGIRTPVMNAAFMRKDEW